MNFAPTREPPGDPAPPATPRLARLLVACCALAALATSFPWIRVRFVALWGELAGPVGARTEAGFTCVMTCLLTALLVLVEGRSQPAREAVRTGAMLLMAIAGLVLAERLWAGPGTLAGVAAAHTVWFFVATVAVAAGIVTCRLRQLPRGSTGA